MRKKIINLAFLSVEIPSDFWRLDELHGKIKFFCSVPSRIPQQSCCLSPRKKCPNSEFFLVPIAAFELNADTDYANPRVKSKHTKIWIRKAPN